MNQHQGPTPTDRQLVALVKGGDSRAFTRIVATTEGLVAQIVFRLIPHEEDRKDVAQEIYIKVYRNLDGFRFQSKLSTWVARIAYNTCITRLEKKNLPLAPKPMEDPEEGGSGKAFHSAEASDRNLLRRELRDLIASELEKLPPIYATLIGLFHQQELSLREVAEITDLPEGTIKNYLHRARKQLKETALSQYKNETL
ncbi:MAG TPA: sigma-70 family RNA polymerase sigma factor [Puia sp.]|nr:sigma-70 family RNA polymerase sigma factor [Puia sp.]